jgi:hypothetical protein
MYLIQNSDHDEQTKLQLLQIFNRIVQQVLDENTDQFNEYKLRHTIGRAILVLADAGQTDPEQLERYALSRAADLRRTSMRRLQLPG